MVELFLFLLVGCLAGTAVGVLPGLGPSTTIALLLPITFGMDPVAGIIMLAGIYYGSQYGGSTTAILLNTPGENSAIMTCIDGHKLAKKGLAGKAIMVSAISSFIAGIIMVIAMAIISPPLADLAFEFGPAEYTALLCLAFFGVTSILSDNLLTGLAAVMIGILVGTVGVDLNSGLERFIFGIDDLYDGVEFVAAAIGMVAFAEVFRNLSLGTIAIVEEKNLAILPTKEDLKRFVPSALRGTFIGGFLGIIPGGGLTGATYAAYTVEKNINKDLGTGVIEGVAAPEAANNAAAQGSLIPLLSLGLPENMAMTLILGAMIAFGIVPGPLVIQNYPDLFWGLVYSIFVGNIILLILNYPLIKIWVSLIKVPYTILYPIIIAVCFIGTYGVNNNSNDLIILCAFITLGYLFLKLDINVVPFILGLILGPMLEEYFRRSLSISQGDFSIFINSNISIGIWLCVLAIISANIYRMRKNV